MSSSGFGSRMSSPMTLGHAAPGEGLTSSASSAASPGVEADAGVIVPTASLPQTPESPVPTPSKRHLEIEDDEGSPQTPTARFRSQIAGGRITSSAANRVVAYQPLRIETGYQARGGKAQERKMVEHRDVGQA